jgi:predicted nucleic acid-binding protein
MAYSRTLLSRSRVLVGDCSALVNEIIEGTRRGNLTSLLAGLHHRAVRLYLPRHVLDELLRHIPVESVTRRQPVDPAVALEWWNTLYAPYARIVDVPADWAGADARVRAVDMRHSTDTPTAQLAATIGPCWTLTEDPDLIDNEFGRHDRLPMLLAAANESELRYVETAVAVPTVIGAVTLSAAGRGFTRLPFWAQIGLVTGSGFLVYYWHHDGRLANRLRQVFDVVTDLGRLAAPPLMTILTRRQAGEVIWENHVVAPNPGRTLAEQVASVVARGPDGGLLARDVATNLDVTMAQSRLVPMVRDVLHASTAFVEVSRGRWVLGEPATDAPSAVSPEMIANWLHRSHRFDPLLRRP